MTRWAIAAAVLLLAACGSDDDEPGPTREPVFTPTSTATVAPPTSTPTVPPSPTPTETPTAAERFSPDVIPDTRNGRWFVPWEEWEAEQPATEKLVAGITVGPDVVRTGIPCSAGEASYTTIDAVAGSLVDFRPAYLPEGTTLNSEEATECRGQVVNFYQSYSLPTDDAPGGGAFFDRARGGYVEIFRSISEPAFSSGIPDYRWEETEIGGQPAALAHPLVDLGFGQSMLIFHDGQVLTFVRAYHLSLDELIEVAEGLR